MKKTCGFVCPLYDSLSDGLERRSSIRVVLVRLITQEHVTRFLSWMNLGGDLLCSEIVLQLKADYPAITLESAFPYENQTEYWSEQQRDGYYNIAVRCYKETLLQYRFDEKCLIQHKRYLADSSDFVLTINLTGKTDVLPHELHLISQGGK